MSETATTPEGVEQLPLKTFSEKAYLDYAMYVILDRALPHIGDGLKPVQRRIIYAMSELGLTAGVKHKKSARTVGDVLGKFHPHGESACYEAMVLMAQPFSFRYPLIDGQGNWGALDDPKSFAAMRYTEARLTRFAAVLLSELGQGTVDWVPNFDGTLEEPALFPARLPHVLLNGASGIAVGMATDLLPHNVAEVVSACLRLLDEPQATVEQLCEHVLGPDFPTAAEIITPSADLVDLYRTGTGSVRARARFERENGVIVITALPYQTSSGKILEQVAAQMLARKLPMLDDLRDESDAESPVRLVLVPRSNRVDVDQLMSHLFATTDLERSYRVNMNVIGIDGRPRVKDLRSLLVEWLEFRLDTVRRRLEFRLEKVEVRLHRLAGLLIAYLNLDEVIAIIRGEDEPKPGLMSRFGLTDIQAEAILELRLRHLARLEEMKIRAEEGELEEERAQISGVLRSKRRLERLVREELIAGAEEFGDERRSPIVAREAAQALSETALIPSETTTVVISSRGWVRAAKGHDIAPETLSYRSGDGFKFACPGRSNHNAVFIDSHGRTYTLPAHTLPSARSQGEPLTGRLSPPEGATFEGVMLGRPDDAYLLASDAGYGFIVRLEAMFSKNRAGKAILSLPAGSRVLPPARIANPEVDTVVAISNEGRLLALGARELPSLGKGKGVKLIQIPPAKLAAREEFVRVIAVLAPTESLTVRAGKRHLTLKPADLEHYRLGRGRRGRMLPRGLRRVDSAEVQPSPAERRRGADDPEG